MLILLLFLPLSHQVPTTHYYILHSTPFQDLKNDIQENNVDWHLSKCENKVVFRFYVKDPPFYIEQEYSHGNGLIRRVGFEEPKKCTKGLSQQQLARFEHKWRLMLDENERKKAKVLGVAAEFDCQLTVNMNHVLRNRVKDEVKFESDDLCDMSFLAGRFLVFFVKNYRCQLRSYIVVSCTSA